VGIIRLQNMAFFARHGVLDAERELGQVFQVDVEMRLDLSTAAASDDIAQTANYAEIYNLVEEVVNGPEFRLLEALAGAILEAIGRRYRFDELTVRVRKPRPPLPGQLDFVEVELSAG
jgi:dihydroneopterin aldolase